MRFLTSQTAWVLTTNNADYLKIQGWKRAVASKSHRKEIVAGNLQERLLRGEFSELKLLIEVFHLCIVDFDVHNKRVGDEGGNFHELRHSHVLLDRLSSLPLLADPFKELPQVGPTHPLPETFPHVDLSK